MDGNKTPENTTAQQRIPETNLAVNSVQPINNQSTKTSHIHPLIIILLLIIFPPVALLFMYREERYHRWFAYVLWLLAALQTIFYSVLAIFVFPQLQSLYENTNMPNSPRNIYISFAFPITIVLIEIIVGILLFKKVKGDFFTYKELLIIAICVLVAGYVLGIVSAIYSFVLPIYNLTNSLH